MQEALGLQSLRLTRFKSHVGQDLALGPLTLLVGRNGSGKSNVLDALSLLALLADERDVRDLERGDEEVAGLRGGLAESTPFGSGTIAVGCTAGIIFDGEPALADLDLELGAGPAPEIRSERLLLHRRGRSKRVLLDAQSRGPGAGISAVSIYSGGAPRVFDFLSARLATAQALTKVPTDTKARQGAVSVAEQVLRSLAGTFVMDPAPGDMRRHASVGALPDRRGTTTSAVLYGLRDYEEAWGRIHRLVDALLETELEDLAFLESGLKGQPPQQVMVALRERLGPHGVYPSPATVISDGTLRYLALVGTMLALGRDQRRVPRVLVVEEVENGLFPTQAAAVLELLHDEARTQGLRLLTTTHSPALLDAVRPEDHGGIVVCSRRSDSSSELRRLVDLDNYVDIAGNGRIGTAVARGALSYEPPRPPRRLSDILAA